MRKLILSLAVISLSAIGASELSAQKVAYFNQKTVIDTLPQYDTLRMEYNTLLQKLQLDIQEKGAEVEKAKAAFEKVSTDPAATATQKELRARSYQNQLQDLELMQQDAEQQLIDLQTSKSKPMMDIVKKAVAEVAKSKGYTLVIDNTNNAVVYNLNNADDLTNLLVAYVAKKYPSAAPAPAAAPKPAGTGN